MGADIAFETGRIGLGHEVDNRTDCILLHAIHDVLEHGSLNARCAYLKLFCRRGALI